MRLRYTLRAADELEIILDDIARRSPNGARRVQSRIQAMIDLLLQHPDAGRLTNKAGLRRIVAIPYPYLIFYRAIGIDQPAAAERWFDRVEARARLLAEQPRIGPRRADIRDGVRMLVERPYVIFYRTDPDSDDGPLAGWRLCGSWTGAATCRDCFEAGASPGKTGFGWRG